MKSSVMIKMKNCFLLCAYQEDSMRLLRLIFFIFVGNIKCESAAALQGVLI